MKQLPASPTRASSRGLAGPVWGLGAALVCALAFFATGAAFWAAITQWGARINLFNLIPVRPLDGGRGFASLSRGQAAIVVLAIGASLLWSGEGMLWLLLLVGGARLVGGGVAGPGDRRAMVEFVVLVAALTALTALPVALPPR
jgi:Zn-dependent protease